MVSNYLKLPPMSRAIAHFVYMKKEADYQSIKERFEERTENGLKEIMSQSSPVLLFDDKRSIYKPSRELELTLKTIRNFV
jgi:hypothetical protein